jgi:hypothetical protein
MSMQTGGVGAIGPPEYLVVHGRARITGGGAAELLQRLAYVYIGPGVTFPPMPIRRPATSPASAPSGLAGWNRGPD